MERDAGVEQRDLKPELFYREKLKEWTERLKSLRSRSRLLGWLRLFVFLMGAVIPFTFFELFSALFFITMLIPLFVFVWLIKIAGKVNYQIEYASDIVEFNSTELRVIDNEFEFLPAGDEFIDTCHDFIFDLDIFGKGSLLQYLNRTSLYGGYCKLAERLSNPLTDKGNLLKLQEAVAGLGDLPEFRQEYYAFGKMTGEEKQQKINLENIAKADLSFLGKKEKYMPAVFIPISGILLGFATAGVLPSSVLLWWFFAGLGITGIYFKQVTVVQKQLSKLGTVLNRYSKLIDLIEGSEFKADKLNELKDKLHGGDISASDAIRKLGRILNLLDQRLNMFTGTLFNGFLLWDLYITGLIKKWHFKNGKQIDEWFEVLREFDALNSLAGFRYNHPGFVFPRFSDSEAIEAKNLGHPLISENERVNNDFDISGENRIVIITGANMAGKSTFLRTVGVNMVLAGTGTVVCATKFVYKPVRLISSMRAFDSLYKHESYFFSELKRLKYIVDEIKRGEQVFFILDEILKGTNSHDKTKGSLALTERLLDFGASGIIATHDLELGKLSKMHPGEIINKCFEVEFDNGSLLFDYILRDGITTSHNATYLMKTMGLI